MLAERRALLQQRPANQFVEGIMPAHVFPKRQEPSLLVKERARVEASGASKCLLAPRELRRQ